ncbi:MAG: dual specificity protein phosphatase family protein [Anaerolineales bacterium]
MKTASKINFVKVGNGRLALYHRPRNEDFHSLREMGCTHIITLLKESEGAEQYGTMTRNAGLEWVWISVPNGKYPEKDVHERLIHAMPQLSQLLDDGKSILIHCSAGIHRTGTVAYGLLRWRGIESKQAMKIIARTRQETAEGMMEKRMRWGDENARQPIEQELPWIHSIKEFVNHWRMKLSRSH